MKTHDQRIAWWRKSEFGCFIHWGVYSTFGGEWKGKPFRGYAEHMMRSYHVRELVDGAGGVQIPGAEVSQQQLAERQQAEAVSRWISLIDGDGVGAVRFPDSLQRSNDPIEGVIP